MRRIIIPQIFPIILPPAANLTVELLKATALVALVTVVDLTFEAKQINSITWLSAQCFGTALLIYYIISRFFLVPFLRWLEVLAARKVGKEKINMNAEWRWDFAYRNFAKNVMGNFKYYNGCRYRLCNCSSCGFIIFIRAKNSLLNSKRYK